MITDVRDITSFKWATVRGVDPLSIQLDGDGGPLALIPDTLVDPAELSVGDRVRVELSLRKVVIHGVSQGRGGSFVGEVRTLAHNNVPQGWLLCRGQALLRSEYPRLFAAIGTTYGAPDATRFNVPPTAGRAVVGLDPAQTEFDTLGKTGGAKTHTLTINEMPQHSHEQRVTANTGGPAARNDYSSDQQGNIYAQGIDTGPKGGGQAHNNLQPYITFNLIIKY